MKYLRNKKKSWIRLLGVLLLVVAISGCGGKKKQEQPKDTNLARQTFAAEKNQVNVMVLKRRDFNKQLISNGKLEARQKCDLAFAASGTLDCVEVREGDYVKKDAVLAALDKASAEASLRSADLAYHKAEITLGDKLLDYGYELADTTTLPEKTRRTVYINSGFADAAVQLATARRNLDDCTLRAPFAGKVANVKAQPYEVASGTFCTLIDDAMMKVSFSVLETEYSFVHVGQGVIIIPFNDPQTRLSGKVISINPTVDTNGQIAVAAQVRNNGRLLDGMNVKVIVERSVADQLVVPKSAVVIRDDKEVLFRDVGGKSLWTYVHVLMSNSTQHVVEANKDRGADLNVGDTIITSGNLNLGDDTPVEIVDEEK